jgi:lysozyme family protein
MGTAARGPDVKTNFPRCLAEVLKHEGGWADHPRDPGGATMKGVTLKTFRSYYPGATKDDLRNITDAQLQRIYRDGYWNAVRGDELPAGLDLVAFDAAVNSGVSRGAKWLQQALGLTAVGKIGPATLAAAKAADPISVIDAALDRRMTFLRGLGTWDVFGKGWTRRVEAVRGAAKGMVAPAAPVPAPAAGGWLAALLRTLAAMFTRRQS